MCFSSAKTVKKAPYPNCDFIRLVLRGEAPYVLPAKPKSALNANFIEPNNYPWTATMCKACDDLIANTPKDQLDRYYITFMGIWPEEEKTDPSFFPPRKPQGDCYECGRCHNKKLSQEEYEKGIPCWSCGAEKWECVRYTK